MVQLVWHISLIASFKAPKSFAIKVLPSFGSNGRWQCEKQALVWEASWHINPTKVQYGIPTAPFCREELELR